jgi:capsular exopolysaccharide synthesis family protein
MQNLLRRYALLARRWAWLVILGMVLCGGTTFLVSKRIPPVYQASAILIVSITTSSSSLDNISASQLIAPTYAQLLTSRQVLQPVVARHPGLTLNQLSASVTAKPQPNTTLIELDVESGNPDTATQLANEISQSFANYSNAQLLGSVQISPAARPSDPIKPKPLLYTEIGILVGLGLALALIVLFENIDDRLERPEEVGELLDLETLAMLPRFSPRLRHKRTGETPALEEGCRMVCASLKADQALEPFKLVMITSALPGEGKSTIAASLASYLAMAGMDVLLVDANLHHPMLDQRFQLENYRGLSEALLEKWTLLQVETAGQATHIPSLRVLTAGAPILDPTELLQSRLADQLFANLARAPFDYIIFDTPPLLPVADTRILASHMQAIIMVVDASKTSRGTLRQAHQLLSRTLTRTVGVVINKNPWPNFSKSRYYPKQGTASGDKGDSVPLY